MGATIPEVYVLWHPRFEAGEGLARRIHTWLRPDHGLGPRVYYRSLPAPGAPAGGLPPRLPGEEGAEAVAPQTSQVLIPLVEENMVADLAWRRWLDRLAAPADRLLLPVALHPTAYNLPGRVRSVNYLRPTGGAGPEATARSLNKQLTEALCPVLLQAMGGPAVLPGRPGMDAAKVSLFLSHAKADGAGPARRLRDYIYSQTQLAAFFDENDIAYGAGFADVIEAELARGAAAMLVVRSAAYASRPWCRRELSAFRRPIDMAGGRWHLNPVLVVEAMDGGAGSAGIPELGNAPCIRWSEQLHDLEELIVTTVLRDVLLAAYHAAVGASLAPGPDRIVIDWLPDPSTLLQIPAIRMGQEVEVVHPGRPMSAMDLATLEGWFPNVAFVSMDEEVS